MIGASRITGLSAGLVALLGAAVGCGGGHPAGVKGLRGLASDLLSRAKDGDPAAVAKPIGDLQIPDKQLGDVYGDGPGKAPAQAYPQAFANFARTAPKAVVGAVKDGDTEIVVEDVAETAKGSGAAAAAAKAKLAEVKPGVALYHLELRRPLTELGLPLGDFAYVDGQWRYVLVGPLANVKTTASK